MSFLPLNINRVVLPRASDFLNERSGGNFRESSQLQSSNIAASFSKNKDDRFELNLNVKNFEPDDLEVKIVDDYLVIHGKHDMKADAHGLIAREFKRRYPLPKDVDIESLQTSLHEGNILHVEIKKKTATKNERVIPIVMQNM